MMARYKKMVEIIVGEILEVSSHITMGHMHKPLANAFTCISER
jgi:hypothetical protein